MRTTIFSPCRLYRYTLWREWSMEPHNLWTFDPHLAYYPGRGTEFLQVIGLNPSTADETENDPTIRRCIRYAREWGFVALCMTNLFAWRDTKPEKMKRVAEPIGVDNDKHLYEIAKAAGMTLCAWGIHGKHRERHLHVQRLLQDIPMFCLGLNDDLSPKHPLFLKADLQPIPFVP